MSPDCKIPVHTKLPLKSPYRTGSYLIYDYNPPEGQDPYSPAAMHFRMGTEIGLRASGSCQIDAGPYVEILNTVTTQPAQCRKLYVVDLRQESHLFFFDRAVSWYADKDWSNVGQSLEWILQEEACRIDMSRGKTVQIFCLDKTSDPNGNVIPTGYSEVRVNAAQSEEEVVNQIAAKLPCPTIYERIPVTDHCRPTMTAVNAFIDLIWDLDPAKTWIHFHCHGGDGRTTTFLAMYDMFCVAKSGTKNFPSIDKFAQQQMKLFNYNLDPYIPPPGCDENSNWKCRLAKERWSFLIEWHKWLADGALTTGEPFEYEKSPSSTGVRRTTRS